MVAVIFEELRELWSFGVIIGILLKGIGGPDCPLLLTLACDDREPL
jgi:hypothetical protein